MKLYSIFLIFLAGCNLFSDSESSQVTRSNNRTETNNGTQTTNTTPTNQNNTNQNNTNQNNSNQKNTTQTTTGTEYEIPFDSIIEESRSTKGLIGQWKFEGDSTSLIEDTSGNLPPMNLTSNNTGLSRIADRNGVVIGVGGQLIVGDPSFLFTELTSSEKFTVELWLKTADFAQTGPTRMVTFSDGSSARNFTLGQQNNKVVARLRANVSDYDGAGRLNGLGQLISQGNLNLTAQHIVWTFDGDNHEIWIDGVRDTSQTIPGGLSNWDPTFQLAFGNEIGADRQWRGELYYAAIYNRPLSPQEIDHHEKLGSDADPMLAQNKDSVTVKDCETWPFDVLKPESFDLFELAKCTIASGSVRVEGASKDKLSTLSNLVEVKGDLILDGVEDDDLDILSNLKSVGGSIVLSNNENLTTFDGFSDLEFVGGDLIIQNNRRVQSTVGFNKITSLRGNLSVSNNTRLASLSGFGNLVTLGGSLSVDRNSSLNLIELDSLETTRRISISHGSVQTISFPMLMDVEEFWLRSTEFLSEIDGAASGLISDDYYFFGNAGLTSISNLLTTQTSTLAMAHNDKLSNLNNVTGLDIRDLRLLSGNSDLTQIGINTLQRVHGDLIINSTRVRRLDNEFADLAKVDGLLQIQNNGVLVSVDQSFPKLEEISDLEFSYNSSLPLISTGFQSLRVVDDFRASFNPILPQCDVDFFMNQFILLGSSIVNDNDDLAVCP